MVALHGVSLLGDSFLNPGLGGIAIPFVGGYRPLWTGAGIIAGYGLAVLGISYYFRDRIGAARWRRLHRLTAVFWVLAVGHTIGAGSDAAQPWFLLASRRLRRSPPRCCSPCAGWDESVTTGSPERYPAQSAARLAEPIARN